MKSFQVEVQEVSVEKIAYETMGFEQYNIRTVTLNGNTINEFHIQPVSKTIDEAITELRSFFKNDSIYCVDKDNILGLEYRICLKFKDEMDAFGIDKVFENIDKLNNLDMEGGEMSEENIGGIGVKLEGEGTIEYVEKDIKPVVDPMDEIVAESSEDSDDLHPVEYNGGSDPDADIINNPNDNVEKKSDDVPEGIKNAFVAMKSIDDIKLTPLREEVKVEKAPVKETEEERLESMSKVDKDSFDVNEVVGINARNVVEGGIKRSSAPGNLSNNNDPDFEGGVAGKSANTLRDTTANKYEMSGFSVYYTKDDTPKANIRVLAYYDDIETAKATINNENKYMLLTKNEGLVLSTIVSGGRPAICLNDRELSVHVNGEWS